jgi:hypothetical protein
MIWSWKLLLKSSLWSGWSTRWKMEWLFWWWICYMCFCFQANVEWDEFPGWSSWRDTEPKEHEPKFKKKRRSKVKYQHLAPGQMLADVGTAFLIMEAPNLPMGYMENLWKSGDFHRLGRVGFNLLFLVFGQRLGKIQHQTWSCCVI